MTPLVILFATWFGIWYWRRKRNTSTSSFSPRKQWALTLAQPMVDATGMTGFFDPGTDHFADTAKLSLRAPLLHQGGFRNNATDDEVREHFNTTLERHWFRIDLQNLSATDDPRAAMAFACVRSAFFVRCAMLMNWIEPEAGWRVLLLNAQRAQDCFDGWEAFGEAFILGRRQWVAAFRADSLGKAFTEASLNTLLTPNTGAWSGQPWHELPALSPRATE